MAVTCAWCGTDEYVEDHDHVADFAYCTGPGHREPRMFQPKAEQAARAAKASSSAGLGGGIAADLGLYGDLAPLLSSDEWADTLVVEYRYRAAHAEKYAWMLNRWGHTAQGHRSYSTSAFIGSTLGQLARAGKVSYRPGPGTGFFRYNSDVGYWSTVPKPVDAIDMSWQRFATDSGLDPETWPLD